MSVRISDHANLSPSEQMHLLLREIADFVALYETLEEKLIAREIALETKLITGEKLLAEQLAKIKTCFTSFQSIMTDAGAARWRIAAETAVREGSDHLRSLKDASFDLSRTFKEGCEQIERTATAAIRGIEESANSFQINDLKESAVRGCEQIKETSRLGIKRISKLIKSFHAKSLMMCIALTIFVIFLTGLYVNDEWPWEIHQQAAKERSAGRTLLAAWSSLTPGQQQEIINASKKKINSSH